MLLVEDHLGVDTVAKDLVVQHIFIAHAGLAIAQQPEQFVPLIQVVAGLHVVIDVRVANRVIEYTHDDGHLADGLVKVVVILRPQLPEAPGDEVDLV